MGKFFILAFVIQSLASHAQFKVFLKNRDTNLPVKYANIWNRNKIVASSDSLGVFYVREADSAAMLTVSAVGYETLDSLVVNRTLTALMANDVITLKDLPVSRPKRGKKLKLGKARNGDVGIVCVQENLVPLIAKYFPNGGSQNLYLDKLRFKAISSGKNRIVGISLYSVGANGKPDAPIEIENIICRIKKGHHVAEVDFAKQNIPFPADGIFVVLNYLQLEQNRQYGPNNKDWFFYEPSINAVTVNDVKDSWFFGQNGWQQNEKYNLSFQLLLTD